MPTHAEPAGEWARVLADRRVAELAARQCGVLSYEQLLGAGLSPAAIEHRVRHGLLHRLHRGVYALGHLALPPLARETAALLAAGSAAALSTQTAGAQWRLMPYPAIVDVTFPPPGRTRLTGIRAHRSALAPAEVTMRHGLRTTTPARTIYDLAAVLPLAELERVVAEAHALRLITPGELQLVPGRRGAARLRAVLDGGPRLTRSEAERRLLALVRAAGLPVPRTNARVAGLEVDAVWDDERIVLEVDSWSFHGHRSAFERDRSRDARLREAGFTPVRVTARRLRDEPERVIAHLARLLARASAG